MAKEIKTTKKKISDVETFFQFSLARPLFTVSRFTPSHRVQISTQRGVAICPSRKYLPQVLPIVVWTPDIWDIDWKPGYGWTNLVADSRLFSVVWSQRVQKEETRQWLRKALFQVSIGGKDTELTPWDGYAPEERWWVSQVLAQEEGKFE